MVRTDLIDDHEVVRASLPPPRPDRPMSTLARVGAIMIPAGICLVGIVVSAILIKTRPEAEHTDPGARGLPVVTQSLTPGRQDVVVRAQGQVVPARQVALSPEVTGRVLAMSPNLIPGGRVTADEDLLRIDGRDYRDALEQQRAQVESSQLSLTQEQSRQVIAQREWALLGSTAGSTDSGRELALREPHTRAAAASVRAAEAGARRAQSNLSRTTLRAPFDAFVQAENVEVGQLVGPGSSVATLVGTDHFWVRVAVPMEQLAWIHVPEGEGDVGSSARVIQHVGEDAQIVRTGRVIRLYGDLDPVGRMARVLVEIDDPLGLAHEDGEPPAIPTEGDPSHLPMLLGAFVDVEIQAGQLEDVYEVPRSALHAGDSVYLFGTGALQIRPLEIVWRRPDSVLARGLAPEDELIVSALPTAIEGTAVRHAEEDAPSETEEPATETAEAP
ncbi:MAG: efflux RND transporter periplasmic adaptor subunit [Sandaracinaceae bacterium]